MSVIAEPERIASGSLAERIASRELELSNEQPIDLPVPGFEQLMVVRYRALGYREMYKIEKRQEKNTDEAEQILFVAADKLITACVQILERGEDGELSETGYKWGSKVARDLWHRELDDEATGRQALLSIFADREEWLLEHFTRYETQRTAIRDDVAKQTAGESEPSEEG